MMKRILTFSGAGLSKESGIPTFRDSKDGLWERAGAKQVIHLHGSLNARKCEWHHSIVGIKGDSEFHCDYRATQTAPVKLGELCPKCGGQLRPDVVWFGEAVDMQWNYFQMLAGQTDVFIGVGTSGQVEPAASLLSVFRKAKEKYFIDPEPPSGLSGYERLKGSACTHMPELAHGLIERLADVDPPPRYQSSESD